jgi:hypothetical protein
MNPEVIYVITEIMVNMIDQLFFKPLECCKIDPVTLKEYFIHDLIAFPNLCYKLKVCGKKYVGS